MAIPFSQLEDAYFFTSFDNPYSENRAWINRRTGETHFYSDSNDLFGEEPDDLWTQTWIELPGIRELGLDSALVFAFAATLSETHENSIRRIFSHKGAYRNMKLYLDDADLLEQWYDYENKATRERLLEWARKHDLEVIVENSKGGSKQA